MRNLTAVFAFATIATLAGCGLLGKKADADAGDVPVTTLAVDAAVAVAAPVGAVPAGKNAAMVGRFPSEQPANEVKILGQAAQPKTSPGVGTVVVNLKAGQSVTRIAENAGYSLIVFPDPNVPTDMLEGWVSDTAFTTPVIVTHVVVVDAGVATAVVDAGPVAVAVVDAGPHCPPGQLFIKVNATAAPVCKKQCTVDKDCKKSCQTATAADGHTTKACMSD